MGIDEHISDSSNHDNISTLKRVTPFSNKTNYNGKNFLKQEMFETGFTVDLDEQIEKIENLNVALISYSEYKDLLDKWSRHVEDIIIATKTPKNSQNIDILREKAKKARADYYDYCNELVDFDDDELVRFDAEIMGLIRNEIPTVPFVSDFGHILSLDINNAELVKQGKIHTELLNILVGYLKYFNTLTKIDCSQMDITTPPDMSDSILEYDISNTPIKKLPQMVSSNLEKLIISDTNIESLPSELPLTLNYIDFQNTPITSNHGELGSLRYAIKERPQLKTNPNIGG